MNGMRVPGLVTEALATDMFADENRQTAYMLTGYNELENADGEQRNAHWTALRGLAALRAVDRQTAQERGQVFDHKSWQPQPDMFAELQSDLYPLHRRLELIKSLDRYIAGSGFTNGEISLLEHQSDVFHDVTHFLRKEPKHKNSTTKRGYIEMPTGTGKTVVFTKLIEAFNQQDKPVKSLVLVPSKNTLMQTVGSEGKRGFSEFAGHLNVTTYYQGKKDLTGDVVVMTYQSFNNLMSEDSLPHDLFDVLVCDEAHNSLGPITKQNLKQYSQDKVAIGLTATPEYGSNKHIEEIFDYEIHVLDLRESIESGILSPVQCWLYKTDYKVDLEPGITNRFTQEELGRLAELEARNRMAVKFARNFVQQGVQGIISCVPGENVFHPVIVAEMLEEVHIVDKHGNRRTIVAEAVSGDMTDDERKDVYGRFEAGEIDVLTFVDLLKEGWDSEAAKFLINLRPTCSPVYSIQRLGRILRQTTDRQIAYVVEFLDDTIKAQHTALHALREYRYYPEKVYGSIGSGDKNWSQLVELPTDLKDIVHTVKARKVREIVVSPNYQPTHSDLIGVVDIAQQLKIPHDVVFNIARYLGLEMTQKIWSDGKKKLYIEDRHIEMIQARLKLSGFANLLKQGSTRDQRNAFYRSLFQNVPPEQREPIIKEVMVSGIRQDQHDDELIETSSPLTEPTRPDVPQVPPVSVVKRSTMRRDFTPKQMSDMLLGSQRPPSEIRDVIMEGLQANPHLVISVLATNAQTNPDAQPQYTYTTAPIGFTCTVKISNHFGEVYEESATATSKKKAQQLAATKLIAKMTGAVVTTEESPFDEVIRLQQPLDMPPGKNPLSILNEYSQTRGYAVKYDTREKTTYGQYKIFECAITTKIADQKVTVTAQGLSKRDAETRAAHELTVKYDLRSAPKARKITPEAQQKQPKKEFFINGVSYKLPHDPVTAPIQWGQLTGEEVTIETVPAEVGEGFIGRITIKKHSGEVQVISGPLKKSKVRAKRAVGGVFSAGLEGNSYTI